MNVIMPPLGHVKMERVEHEERRSKIMNLLRRSDHKDDNEDDDDDNHSGQKKDHGGGAKPNGNKGGNNGGNNGNSNNQPSNADAPPPTTTEATTTIVVVSTLSAPTVAPAPTLSSTEPTVPTSTLSTSTPATTIEPTETFTSLSVVSSTVATTTPSTSSIPITSSLASSSTASDLTTQSTSEARLGLSETFSTAPSTSSAPTTIFVSPIAETASSSGPTLFPTPAPPKHNGLPPTTVHALVASASVGATCLVFFIIFMVARAKGYRLFAKKGWSSSSSGMDFSDRGLPDGETDSVTHAEKEAEQQSRFDGFFSPIAIPKKVKERTTRILSSIGLQRAAAPRGESLINNAQPFSYYPPQSSPNAQAYPNETSNSVQRNVTPESTQQDPASTSLQSDPQPSLSLPPLDRPPLIAPMEFEPNVYRFSELSSISSGFGDANIIVPDPNPTRDSSNAAQASSGAERQSKVVRDSRFSFAQSDYDTRRGDRDTVYTATSEDAPRFRSVNSWVGNQATRIQRRFQSEQEVTKMPEVPVQYAANVAPIEPPTLNGPSLGASSPGSGDFSHHPGDEIVYPSSARIPSTILDKKLRV